MATIDVLEVDLFRGKHHVLNKLSWHVDENVKQIGLVGRNGAGKSSLCRLLNGLIEPDRGSVVINGQQPKARCARTIKQVGYLFQNSEHQLICPLVLEEMCFGLVQLGHSESSAKMRAFKVLDEHELRHWALLPVAELSPGQQKLVCLMSVLVGDPELLVLDEPFAGMDLYSASRFQHRLKMLPQLQIVISHNLEHLQDYSRVSWLHEGKWIADGKPSEVINAYRKASAITEAFTC